MLDAKTRKLFDPNLSCTEKGATRGYDEGATLATTAAVKAFLTTTVGWEQ